MGPTLQSEHWPCAALGRRLVGVVKRAAVGVKAPRLISISTVSAVPVIEPALARYPAGIHGDRIHASSSTTSAPMATNATTTAVICTALIRGLAAVGDPPSAREKSCMVG